MKKYFYLSVCTLVCLMMFNSDATAQNKDGLMQAPDVTLQSAGLSLRFIPSRAWTFDEIRYQEKLLNNPGSFSGLVLNFGGGLFLGTGHNQAGNEKVHSIQLTIDGDKVDLDKLLKGGIFTGNSLELVKESDLVTTEIEVPSITHLKSVIRMNNGILECEQFLTPNADTDINKLYAFMFSWTSQTTQWMAKTPLGKIREGNFSKSWELTDDVQWTSIYNPVLKTAAVTIFDKDSWEGAGIAHGYWNVKPYHKEYYQPVEKITLKKDTTYHWGVKVLFIKTDENHWKETVEDSVKRIFSTNPIGGQPKS